MKKSVLALAVLGTFAGVASAQSSVTMFGVVDLNVMSVDNDDRTYSMGTDGMSSSRLGFRGVEDLGGGLKASFWLEMGLATDTGRNASIWGNGRLKHWARNDNALFFNRRSTVSLSNQWGELRLGRDYTPTFWSWTVFDPFGTNGVGSATNLALSSSLRESVLGRLDLRHTGPRQQHGAVLPAGRRVRPRPVWPDFGGCGRKRSGQQVLGWSHRLCGRSVRRGRCLWRRPSSPTACDLNVWNIGGSWNFGFMKLSGFYGQMRG